MKLAGAIACVRGGTGFISSHLADALLARGAAIHVLDNLSTGRPPPQYTGTARLDPILNPSRCSPVFPIRRTKPPVSIS